MWNLEYLPLQRFVYTFDLNHCGAVSILNLSPLQFQLDSLLLVCIRCKA